MFTFGFFVRVFFSGLICAFILSNVVQECQFGDTLLEKIIYWTSGILLLVACGCMLISIFGLIWTA